MLSMGLEVLLTTLNLKTRFPSKSFASAMKGEILSFGFTDCKKYKNSKEDTKLDKTPIAIDIIILIFSESSFEPLNQ